MSEKCKWCGAEFNMEFANGDTGWQCGTVFTVGGHWHISKVCHGKALAAKDELLAEKQDEIDLCWEQAGINAELAEENDKLEALLREAVEVIKKVRECPSIRIECSNCRGRIDDFLDNTEIKALMKEGG